MSKLKVETLNNKVNAILMTANTCISRAINNSGNNTALIGRQLNKHDVNA